MTTTEPKPLEWAALWGEMGANYDAGRAAWVETTAAMYDAMLNAVPPTLHVSGGFLCGEAWNHNAAGEPVYAAFTRRAGRVTACYLTFGQFCELVG